MKRHRDTSPGPATSVIGHTRSSRPGYREGHHHQTNFVDTKSCKQRLCACPAMSYPADHYQAPAEAMWYQQPQAQGYWVQAAGAGCQQQMVAWPWLQPSTWHYAPVPPPPPFWNPYSWPAPPPPSSCYYCGHAPAAGPPAPAALFWPPPPTCCMDQLAPLDTSCCCHQCCPSSTTHCFHQPACMEPQEEWTSKSKHAAAHQQPRGADGDDDVLVKEVVEERFFTMLPSRGRL